VLKDFITNDTYPLMMEFMAAVNWYVMDLHDRVIALEGGEEDDDDEMGEYMDPQFASGVLEYVGRFLHISQRVMEWAKEKGDEEVLINVQLLTAASPGIMAHINEVMAEDEEEDEEEEGLEDAYGEAERDGDAENVVEPDLNTDEPKAEQVEDKPEEPAEPETAPVAEEKNDG